MNNNPKFNGFRSETFELAKSQQMPLLGWTDSIDVDSKSVQSNLTDSQSMSRISFDEEKINKNFGIQKQQSAKAQERQTKNAVLMKKFSRAPYVSKDESLALNKIYSEVKVKKSEKQNTSCPKLFTYIEERIPVLELTSKALILWNVFVSLLVIFFFFEIPIYLAWGNTFWSVSFFYLQNKQTLMPLYVVKIFTTICYIIFIVDVGLQFITAYYQHGNLITKKTKIANNYLKNNFIYDIIAISAFAVRVNFNTDQERWIYFMFYFKAPSLMKVSYQFEEMILLKRRIRTAFSIGKIMLFMFFAFDLFGCFFFIIGSWCVDEGYPSWLSHTGGNFGVIDQLDIHKQFFFSFYFSLGTMSSTMGYGDITPLNIYECSYCLCGIIFAVMIFAININAIFKILEEYNSSSLKIFRARIAINRFLKTNKVPNHLGERVRQYLNEYWFEEGTRDSELERSTICKLAPELREELMYFSYGKFLQQTEMFSQNFSRPFLKALALQVQEISYSQGETIFRDRDNELFDDKCFYFIISGSVMIHPLLGSKTPESTYIKKLKAGEHFGEWGFFTGMDRMASAEAHSYSLMYVIKREDFLQTLQRFADDYEHYCIMKDKLLMEKDFRVIGVKCWTCGSSNHLSTNCTVTHYRPSVQTVVDLETSDQTLQDRHAFERQDRNKWPTLQNQIKLVKLTKRTRIKGLNCVLLNKQRYIKKKTIMVSSIYSPPKLAQRARSSLIMQPLIIEPLEPQQDNPVNEKLQQDNPPDLRTSSQFEDHEVHVHHQRSPDTKAVNEVRSTMMKQNEQMEMQRQFGVRIPYIQPGLQGFDKPHTFKRYKTYENRQNIWATNGQMLAKK